ncbi:hypothetical protein SLS60_005022 [Paraconiothyrium brasiliense]|uniref:Uncharacterized protein n=1 Tax=Paraconiothyrium brasiliense TaxID=300254 RepID=A0ABR3RG73_9PLEO
MHVDELSVTGHQHDDLFWNSTLEEKGDQVVPEHDVLGRVEGTPRAYWVKDLPHAEVITRGDEVTGTPNHGGPVAQDFAFEASGPSSPSPASRFSNSSRFSNWDLYAPPTPPTPSWPERSDSLKRTHFEPAVLQRSSIHALQDPAIGQDERPYDPQKMRGGGQLAAYELNLPPHVLGNITAFAEAHPLKNYGQTREYEALRTVGFRIDGEPIGRTEEMQGAMRSYPLPWYGDFTRPSTEDLEDVYLPPESAAEASKVTSTSVSSAPARIHAVEQPSIACAPDIPERSALRNDRAAEESTLMNGIGEKELAESQKQVPTTSKNLNPLLPRRNGILTGTVDDLHPTHRQSPPSETNARSRTPPSLHLNDTIPSTSSTIPPPHAHPPGFTTDDKVPSHDSRDAQLRAILNYYEQTLTRQAASIRNLHEIIDQLTDRCDYYEHDLLPKTLTHWSETNHENHALAAGLRQTEEENALLWGFLEFSQKLLHLCWQRDEAVLVTARTMRERKTHRANCAMLERLVNSFGPGRGGGKERTRGESPFRDDLEQLVFVCEQNLKVFGEDLEDWNGNLEVVQGMREERENEGDEVEVEYEDVRSRDGVRDV